jgi:hypothetical protein
VNGDFVPEMALGCGDREEAKTCFDRRGLDMSDGSTSWSKLKQIVMMVAWDSLVKI